MREHDDTGSRGGSEAPLAAATTTTGPTAAAVFAAVHARARARPPLDSEVVRRWLTASRPHSALSEAVGSAVAAARATANRASVLQTLPELVDHASEADLFGDDRRVTLWYDRDLEGRITGWHLTVELTGDAVSSPAGHRLRLAGTWSQTSTLWSPDYDPPGTGGLVVALVRVAEDAQDTVARSFGALLAGDLHEGR